VQAQSTQAFWQSAPHVSEGWRQGRVIAIAVIALAAGALLPAPNTLPSSQLLPEVRTSHALSDSARDRVLAKFEGSPLSFVENAGQIDSSARYYAQGAGYSFSFTDDRVLLSFAKPTPESAGSELGAGRRFSDRSERVEGVTLALEFVGASGAAVPDGSHTAPGKVNYLIGDDPDGWHTGLATYEQIVYRDLWPGIDMAFSGSQGKLKYSFVVAPGASPSDIALAYRGADDVFLNRRGSLALRTPVGTLRDSRPVSYQEIGGSRRPIATRFVMRDGPNDRTGFGFALGADYDTSRPLVIDPELRYSTFLGGGRIDEAWGIAVRRGRAYVTGDTLSGAFPTTPGAFDVTRDGSHDAFVTKLNRTGSALAYSTFLGGGSSENGLGIAAGRGGSAYVTGFTESADFPTTPGAFDTIFNGDLDAFVTKLSRTGSALAYSTFLGGGSSEEASGIAARFGGSAYVTGFTQSADFPTTPGAFDATFNDDPASFDSDAFVTKLDPTGSTLAYSTFLGAAESEEGAGGSEAASGIAVDPDGRAYVTGLTTSEAFPTTPGAFDTSYNDPADVFNGDVFVTKFNPAGSALGYSTFLGARNEDAGDGIALDGHDHAYVTGSTHSARFPTTSRAFDTTHNGSEDAFVTKLRITGSALAYSTFLGAGGGEVGSSITVHRGQAYVTGSTTSARFPTTGGAFDRSYNDRRDALVTKLNAAGSALGYSTYLGGPSSDDGSGIGVAPEGRAYVTGSTRSARFPTTQGAFDRTHNGSVDAFVSKVITTRS
jgi:hypothetical protein